jgi:hypothetical protein
MIHELEMICKEVAVVYFRYGDSTCLEGPGKTIKILNQNFRCPAEIRTGQVYSSITAKLTCSPSSA